MGSSDGGKRVFGENPVLVPVFSPVPHGLYWDRTQASAVRGRRLIA